LTAQSATQLAVDDGANVAGIFGDGLWRFTEQTLDWQKLSDFKPTDVQVTPAGAVFANFASIGLWRWDAVNGWSQLSTFTAASWVVNSNEVLFGQFRGDIWRWAPDTGWSRISIGQGYVLGMQSDDVGNLYLGLWGGQGRVSENRWSPLTGWSGVYQGFYGQRWLSVSNRGDVYVTDSGRSNVPGYSPYPFPYQGQPSLWYYPSDGSAAMPIEDRLASPMAARRNGDLFAGLTTVRLGPFGPPPLDAPPLPPLPDPVLSLYQPGLGWTQINNLLPDSVAVGSNDGLFANYGTGGLWYWTSANGWVRLSGEAVSLMTSQTR
jgi:hypothetical protein